MVTKRSTGAVVPVPVAEWQRVEAAAPSSLKQLLLLEGARSSALAAPRGRARRRPVEAVR